MNDYLIVFFLGGLTVFISDILIANYFEKKQGWCRYCGPSCKRKKL